MQLYKYLVRHVIVMLLFPYMTSFLMTTCERLISETTINRNNCKTMSNIETKFGGSWIFFGSVFLCKLHVLHFKNSYVTWSAEYLRTGRNWPFDSTPSCPGSHDLRSAGPNTYNKMKAISLHYNITDQLSD